ncbi:MAG: hypothetical protein ORN50_05275, partial [Crocinitomicaceae bacterium]|nr:hypothetical protein [Crocinitomicaceae bacterium]
KHLKAYMEFLSKGRNEFFGNARQVRKIVEESIKNQHLRLAMLEPEKRNKEMIHELTYDDVKEFEIDYSKIVETRKPSIGFKLN